MEKEQLNGKNLPLFRQGFLVKYKGETNSWSTRRFKDQIYRIVKLRRCKSTDQFSYTLTKYGHQSGLGNFKLFEKDLEQYYDINTLIKHLDKLEKLYEK